MKNRLLLCYRKIKRFITKKRRFPILISISLLTKDARTLRIQIIELRHNNTVLKKEIRRLKTIIEIRDMQISLDKKGGY